MSSFNIRVLLVLDMPIDAQDLTTARKVVEGVLRSGRMSDGSSAWAQLDNEHGYLVFDQDFTLIDRG